MSQVPNSDSFTLLDVIAAVESHAGAISDDLAACFANASASFFDPTYNNLSYAPEDSMKRFRNYTPTQNKFYWLSPAVADIYMRGRLWKSSEPGGSLTITPATGSLIWAFVTQPGQPGVTAWNVFQQFVLNLKVSAGYWIADIRVQAVESEYVAYHPFWFYNVVLTSPGPTLSQFDPFIYMNQGPTQEVTLRLAVEIYFKTGSGAITFVTGINGSSVALNT